LHYSSQLRAKEEIFKEMLVRATGVESNHLLAAIAAPIPLGYRTRVQFKVRAINGKVCIGFYRTGSHFVVDLPDQCPVAVPILNNLLPALRNLLEQFPHNDKIPQIDAAAGAGDAISLIFHCLGDADKHLECVLKKDGHRFQGASLFIQSGRKNSIRRICGEDRLYYSLPASGISRNTTIELSFSRGGFSQVNAQVNRLILTELIDWLDLKGTERILDLYCGNGNFSLPLAALCREIVGVEEYAPSITDALFSMNRNSIGNARFLVNRADNAVEQLIMDNEHFDCVLLDPPRQGALETIKKLVRMNPAKIFYISCDPATLARDASFLKHAGYELVTSRVFDMFPQTHHIESLSYLIKTA
jgi:23S rRNA (uracil1939-C5)-methyltransferase